LDAPFSGSRFLDWRLLVCGLIIGTSLLPTLWLVFSAFKAGSFFTVLSGPFAAALKRTLVMFAAVTAGALLLGWPTGTVIGLVRFPGRWLLLAALALPVFTPSSLWAIGVSAARSYVAYRHQWWFDGFAGALLTGLVQALPLVLFATTLLARAIPASQIDAARLAGGGRSLLKLCARFSFPAALAAAVLGGLMVLADPGPAQIMGYHGIASEILIAFSARYNPALAAQKASWMTLFLAPIVLPIAGLLAVWSDTHLLGRDLRQPQESVRGALPLIALVLCVLLCLFVFLPPAAGFIRPLRSSQSAESFQQAWAILRQSALTTLSYGFTAATLATILGLLLILLTGRKRRTRFLLLLFCFMFLSLPASLHALGFASMATRLPESFDLLTREGNAPGVALGLRLLPIPVLFCLRAWSLIPESCHQSAALHGVPALRYHWKVSLPRLGPAVVTSFLLVALATAADVSSTLLLLPPGAATFTTRIFGVIDSTTERTLSALCVVYLSGGLIVLGPLSLLGSVLQRKNRN
jgi:iron(III) transport system permease protein